MSKDIQFHRFFIYGFPILLAIFALPNSYYTYSLPFTPAYKIDQNGKLAELPMALNEPYGGIPRELAPALTSLIPIPEQIYHYNICALLKTDTGSLSYPEVKITRGTESSSEDTKILIPNVPFCMPSEAFKTFYVTGKFIKDEESILKEIVKLKNTQIYQIHSDLVFDRVPLYWPPLIYLFITIAIGLLWWPFLLLFANIDPQIARHLFSKDSVNSKISKILNWCVQVLKCEKDN